MSPSAPESMSESQARLLKEFEKFPDWDARYARLIQMGRELPAMPENFRTEANKIKGCQAQVWLFPELKDGRIQFHADSDALITKGIVALLATVYSGQSPDAILTEPLFLLDKLELSKYLSPTRSNGLAAMVKQIKLYALALKARTG